VKADLIVQVAAWLEGVLCGPGLIDGLIKVPVDVLAPDDAVPMLGGVGDAWDSAGRLTRVKTGVDDGALAVKRSACRHEMHMLFERRVNMKWEKVN
jgi:hypothetical protein